MDRTGHNTICFDVAQVDGSTYHGYMEFNIPWRGLISFVGGSIHHGRRLISVVCGSIHHGGG